MDLSTACAGELSPLNVGRPPARIKPHELLKVRVGVSCMVPDLSRVCVAKHSPDVCFMGTVPVF